MTIPRWFTSGLALALLAAVLGFTAISFLSTAGDPATGQVRHQAPTDRLTVAYGTNGDIRVGTPP